MYTQVFKQNKNNFFLKLISVCRFYQVKLQQCVPVSQTALFKGNELSAVQMNLA